MENEAKAIAPNMANKIIGFHEEAGRNLQNAFHCAINAGKALKKVKESVEHGGFGPWVEENLPFDLRTAQRYMKLSENQKLLDKTDITSLSEAYKLLETPKIKEPDDFAGEFRDEDEDEENITTGGDLSPTIDAYAKYPYWPNLKRIIKVMDAEYLKLVSRRDHTTPKGLGYMIGNIKDMSNRLQAWDPDKLYDCPNCGGTCQVENEDLVMATCSICINGKIGPYRETDL